MDTISEELVKVGRGQDSMSFRLSSIEVGLVDVELKNGGGGIIKQPRQQLIQQAYDYVKPDGILDKKFDEVEEKFDKMETTMCEKFDECRQNCYDPHKQSENSEKKYDRMWKWGTRVGVIIIAIVTLFSAIEWGKLIFKW
jgi:hypothetical protein